MNTTETDLESCRVKFLHHIQRCPACRGFDHSGRAMSSLCWSGLQAFYALAEAENCYIKSCCRVPARPASSLRDRARRSALGQGME